MRLDLKISYTLLQEGEKCMYIRERKKNIRIRVNEVVSASLKQIFVFHIFILNIYLEKDNRESC